MRRSGRSRGRRSGGAGRTRHRRRGTPGRRAADGAHRDPPDRGKQVVAGGVAALIVDLLEVVDVHEQERQRGSCRVAPARAGGPAPPGTHGGCRGRSAHRAANPRGPGRRGPRAGRGPPSSRSTSRSIGAAMRAMTKGMTIALTARKTSANRGRAAAGPKPLHRGNTHERDELDRHDPDHPATDGGGGLAGGGFRWVWVGLLEHGHAEDGRCQEGCTSPASLL